ncbi:uncharacterized protein [Linepithema humile]|uniref:uncharacterized protein n=1 Tax=Linepithema humile TaxID=83485 RepID=UPI00351E38C1
MAAEEDDCDGSRRHGSLAAKKIRGRPRHGTKLGSRDRRQNADRSPRPGPARQPDPLPEKARHAPLLRANPYSEVTDPICRLPLPTLVYRLEAFYLGDLLRIWVRTGATPPRGSLLDFQGPRGRSGHRRNCGALCVPNPISLLEISRELERLYKKENSSRISRRRLQVILGYPDEHSYEGPNCMRFRCRVPE